MLCIRLKGFDQACQKTTGGVSKIWIYDRDDFNFTQAANDADGSKGKYTAIARRDGATSDGGANLYPVKFQFKEAEYKYTQSLNGASVKYEHSLEFLISNLSHVISTWNDAVDSAAACCGIGVIVQLNSGVIFVLGEKYVNTEEIPEWRIAQSGSTGTSGKLYEDPNGQTTILTGDYSRSAYEYSGSVASLTALQEQDES